MNLLFLKGDSLWFEIQRLEGLLNENVLRLQDIDKNTTLDFYYDGMNLLGIISIAIAAFALFFEMKTLYGVKGTKDSIIAEAEKNRIDKECQFRLFQDIIRHLYRNKVCILAMEAKLQHYSSVHAQAVADGLATQDHVMYYPSEEHILKLKLLTSDIHLEEYYRDSNTYFKLHEMELLLRNYNTEIDSSFIHIPSPYIDAATKARDFSTLNFKTAYIIVRLVELMDIMWPEKNNLADAQQIIQKMQIKNVEDNEIDSKVSADYAPYIKLMVDKELQDTFVMRLLKGADSIAFKDGLISDLLIECGVNTRNEEKIHIIERKL